MEKKTNKIKDLRFQVLQEAKKHVSDLGWNEKLLIKVQQNLKFKNNEMSVLFSDGYQTILEMYLDIIY